MGLSGRTSWLASVQDCLLRMGLFRHDTAVSLSGEQLACIFLGVAVASCMGAYLAVRRSAALLQKSPKSPLLSPSSARSQGSSPLTQLQNGTADHHLSLSPSHPSALDYDTLVTSAQAARRSLAASGQARYPTSESAGGARNVRQSQAASGAASATAARTTMRQRPTPFSQQGVSHQHSGNVANIRHLSPQQRAGPVNERTSGLQQDPMRRTSGSNAARRNASPQQQAMTADGPVQAPSMRGSHPMHGASHNQDPRPGIASTAPGIAADGADHASLSYQQRSRRPAPPPGASGTYAASQPPGSQPAISRGPPGGMNGVMAQRQRQPQLAAAVQSSVATADLDHYGEPTVDMQMQRRQQARPGAMDISANALVTSHPASTGNMDQSTPMDRAAQETLTARSAGQQQSSAGALLSGPIQPSQMQPLRAGPIRQSNPLTVQPPASAAAFHTEAIPGRLQPSNAEPLQPNLSAGQRAGGIPQQTQPSRVQPRESPPPMPTLHERVERDPTLQQRHPQSTGPGITAHAQPSGAQSASAGLAQTENMAPGTMGRQPPRQGQSMSSGLPRLSLQLQQQQQQSLLRMSGPYAQSAGAAQSETGADLRESRINVQRSSMQPQQQQQAGPGSGAQIRQASPVDVDANIQRVIQQQQQRRYSSPGSSARFGQDRSDNIPLHARQSPNGMTQQQQQQRFSSPGSSAHFGQDRSDSVPLHARQSPNGLTQQQQQQQRYSSPGSRVQFTQETPEITAAQTRPSSYDSQRNPQGPMPAIWSGSSAEFPIQDAQFMPRPPSPSPRIEPNGLVQAPQPGRLSPHDSRPANGPTLSAPLPVQDPQSRPRYPSPAPGFQPNQTVQAPKPGRLSPQGSQAGRQSPNGAAPKAAAHVSWDGSTSNRISPRRLSTPCTSRTEDESYNLTSPSTSRTTSTLALSAPTSLNTSDAGEPWGMLGVRVHLHGLAFVTECALCMCMASPLVSPWFMSTQVHV